MKGYIVQILLRFDCSQFCSALKYLKREQKAVELRLIFCLNTPGEHRIIEVGCVEIIDRKLTGRTLQLYVNPERPVDEEAFQVHGISNEFLADKPKFAEVANQLIDFIRGSELLIHNAKFDVGFMDKEWQLLGLSETTTDMATVVDTVSLAMQLCPGHQVNLDNLCNLYDVDKSARTVHGALFMKMWMNKHWSD